MVGRRAAGWSGREQVREYVRPLGLAGDVIRVRWITERGNVTAYTVQYEAWIEGTHRNIARYDTAHDAPHLDLLGWGGEVVEKRWRPASTYAEALTADLADVDANWRAYREDFVRRKP